MPALSSNVELVLHRGFVLASEAGHGRVEIEHVLLSSLEVPAAVEYFEQHHIGAAALRADLASALSQSPLIDTDAEDRSPTVAAALQTAVTRAILTAEREFKKRAAAGQFQMEVTLPDLLTSLLQSRSPKASGPVGETDLG